MCSLPWLSGREDYTVRRQFEFKPRLIRFFIFLFSFSFAVVCLSFRSIFLFLVVFCSLVCLSFIPTAAPSSELHAKLDKTPQRER